MTFKAPPATRIGHVHLRVSDLERSLDFYCGVLGLHLVQRYGAGAAFIAAGDYHHHIGLNTWASLGATPPPAGHTGLYHLALLFPDERSLAMVCKSVLDAGLSLTGAADHGVSVALYLDDPDRNGVELYWDKPMDVWPRSDDGTLAMVNDPIDLDALLAKAA